MGTLCAPSYANIFMGKFELKFINPFIKDKTLLYLGYIDDLFFVWKGTQEKFSAFFEIISKVRLSVKFDFNYSYDSIIQSFTKYLRQTLVFM